MEHFPKYAGGAAALLFLLLLALRDQVPARYAKMVGALVGVLGGIVPSIVAGADPLDALNHVIVGTAFGALAGHAAAAPLTVPPLPLLCLALLACTPSERATAATVAQGTEVACEEGLRYLAGAPELAPLCATIPEVEAAVAELVAEHQAAPDAGPAYEPPVAEVHRRVHRHRHRKHADAGAP